MAEIDDLFAQMREVPVSRGLEARVLQDAARLQPRFAPVLAAPGFWARFSRLFGGAGMMAGLGSAALAGVYLGFVQPGALGLISDRWPSAVGVERMELMPDVESFLSEGQTDE